MSTIEFVNHIKDKKFDIELRTPFTCISKVISEWIGESYSVATLKRPLLFRRYFDSFPLTRDLRQARRASLRRLQSAAGKELRPLFGRTLLPSILDKA